MARGGTFPVSSTFESALSARMVWHFSIKVEIASGPEHRSHRNFLRSLVAAEQTYHRLDRKFQDDPKATFRLLAGSTHVPMDRALFAEIQRLGGDPTDDVWRWFVLNGPHGSGFTWGQSRSKPPGYVGVEHLQRIVGEMAVVDPTFPGRAKGMVDQALASKDINFLCRAIQVAAVVGAAAELRRVSALTSHENELVAAHARAAAFYLRAQIRTGRVE